MQLKRINISHSAVSHGLGGVLSVLYSVRVTFMTGDKTGASERLPEVVVALACCQAWLGCVRRGGLASTQSCGFKQMSKESTMPTSYQSAVANIVFFSSNCLQQSTGEQDDTQAASVLPLVSTEAQGMPWLYNCGL
jgi:hypothetical protein